MGLSSLGVAPATSRPDSWRRCRGVFPEVEEQRCRIHGVAKMSAELPKSAHLAATKAFAIDYEGKFPKTVARITDGP